VPGIVGFAKALEIAAQNAGEEAQRLQKQRDLLEKLIFDALPEVYVNGCSKHRLPHVSNLLFKGIEAVRRRRPGFHPLQPWPRKYR